MKHVLVTGGNFLNQGAYLMLVAAAQGVREHLGAQPVISFRFGSEREKRWIGYETLLAEERLGFFPRLGRNTKTQKLRDRLPFVTASDVDAVFDITGFAFGDQWVDAPLMRRARNYENWKKRGVPIYMMPQAFGPFEKTAEPAKLAIESSRIAYARDNDSLEYVNGLFHGRQPGNVRHSPDFTGAVHGRFPVGYEDLRGAAAIVPNWNIAERAGSDGDRNAYVRNLAAAVRTLREAGMPVYGLTHEGRKDRAILERVAELVPDFRIVSGLNGIELKGLLGTCSLVVGGRYHALISALAQGVPAILHGWSHKYRWLAEDYDVAELISDPLGPEADLTALIGTVLADQSIRERILAASAEVKAKNGVMWGDIAKDFSGVAARR